MTKRNTNESSRGQTQRWNTTMSGLTRVREKAKKDKQQSFTALMHHITPELLSRSFYRLKRQSATGIDGVRWRDYQEGLESRLVDLHGSTTQRPLPAKPRTACLHTEGRWVTAVTQYSVCRGQASATGSSYGPQ